MTPVWRSASSSDLEGVVVDDAISFVGLSVVACDRGRSVLYDGDGVNAVAVNSGTSGNNSRLMVEMIMLQ